MVETRMDAMVSRLASQAQTVQARPAVDRPARPQAEQVLEARPAKETQSAEASVARIFARRAFQTAEPQPEVRVVSSKANPRGGNLDILA